MSTGNTNTIYVASDLEGTLSSGESWKGLGAYLTQHGFAKQYQGFFRSRFAEALLARIGLVNRRAFANRWISDVLGLCAGWSVADFQRAATWIVEHEIWPKRFLPLLAELEAAAKAGKRIVIASGTYEPILLALKNEFTKLGIAIETIGTPLEVQDDKLTGRLAGAINTASSKAERLKAFLRGRTLQTAYGDTIEDVLMLEMASEAVAVSPKGPLRAVARGKNWRILQ
jgi:phosphoserine phosphatase